MTEPIRVLVVDDSPFVCRVLTSHLHREKDIEVVATALSGKRALQLTKELQPDAVTMDLEMPEMNGLEALEQIMAECPTPVIMITGASRRAAQATSKALEMGAIDFVLKYVPGIDTDPAVLAKEVVSKVRAAAQIKVIRSLKTRVPVSEAEIEQKRARMKVAEQEKPPDFLRDLPGGVIVIGASTGGPIAVRELLSELPEDLPAAVVIVQHMPATFTGIFADQLNRHTPLTVKEAETGDAVLPNSALVAPGDFHLLLRPDRRVELNQGPKIGGHRPSIDVTMQSAAQVYGPRTRGVVLTGMGSDGALGLLAIRSRGGATFAQDAESSVINGMPQRAVDKGVVDHIASPADIARLLCRQPGVLARKAE